MNLRQVAVTLGLAASGLLLASGCGGASLSKTVDPDNLTEMSREGKLWVYDAENGIIVALDKLDEAKDRLIEIRRDIEDAEAAIERAEKRKNRLGVQVAEAWLEYLELLEEWAEENIELQRHGVVVAAASTELAKAQVINREDLLGGDDFDARDYQEQYNELRKEHVAMEKRVGKLRDRARKGEKKWWKLRQRFVASTGDYDSGLWID
jgi:chromosome segregation ATPase